MKQIYEILAPLVCFLNDEAIASICLSVPHNPDRDDPNDEDRRGFGNRPESPRPLPSLSTA